MPAYFDCGFSVRQPSWHGLETVLGDYPADWDDARMAAGLMWEPRQVPVYTQKLLTAAQIDALTADDQVADFHVIGAPGNGQIDTGGRPDRKFQVMVAAEGHMAIERDDTGDVLAVPSDSYSLITHANMGEIIDAVMGADANVKFETAGSVREGRQVWALVRLDEPFQVPGDSSPSYPFLALLNAHDGSASCSLTYTTVRVVCWNTWSAADAEGARNGARYVFRHTGDVQARISEAKAALGNLRAEVAETQQLFTQLAQTPINPNQVKTFTELFLPSPRDNGEICSDRVHQNVLTARQTFDRLHTSSITMEGLQDSAYGLLQASTEYLDHIRRFRTRDTYVGRTILRPERLKGHALKLIEEVVAA
jgi:phage/plasmid-like protein (TIGR03299 family)